MITGRVASGATFWVGGGGKKKVYVYEVLKGVRPSERQLNGEAIDECKDAPEGAKVHAQISTFVSSTDCVRSSPVACYSGVAF